MRPRSPTNGEKRSGLQMMKLVIPAGDTRLAPEPFDWSGVIVNHWRVTSMPSIGKGGRAMYSCVSRCGVRSPFRRDALASGATATCEGCRVYAVAPPAARVTEEQHLPAHSKLWESIAVVDINNKLGSKTAQLAWSRHGLPLLMRTIDGTGLGRDFGWKLCVHNCRESPAPRAGVVRIVNVIEQQRKLAIVIKPAEGGLVFEANLTTGRTDRPFTIVQAAFKAACEKTEAIVVAPTNGKSHPAAAPAPTPQETAKPEEPAKPADATFGGVSLDALLALRSNLDTVISVGRDMQTTAELKREISAVVDERRKVVTPLQELADDAVRVATREANELSAAQSLATELQNKLAAAVADCDRLSRAASMSAEVRDRALAELRPALEQLREAEQQLAEAEKMETDRVKALGKADDMVALFAALKKMGV